MEITQVTVSFETQIQFSSKNIILRQMCPGCLIHGAFSEQITPRFRHMEIPYVPLQMTAHLLNYCVLFCDPCRVGFTPLSYAHVQSICLQQNPKPSSEDAAESKSFLEGCSHASLGTSGRCWYTALCFA